MAKNFIVTKDTPEYFEFVLLNCNVALANAIRRVILSEIETYAIDENDIHILENTCPLHNEYISHRLSLIPIKQNIGDIENYKFYISKEKTTNQPIENGNFGILEVTTKNVQIYNSLSETWIDPNEVFDGEYLITKLNLKQKILGEFKVSKGVGKTNARWQCVGTIGYRYLLEKDDIKNLEYDKISLEDERKWVKKGDSNEPLGFVFYLEPLGKLSGKEIVEKALKIIVEKCEKFKTYIEENTDNIIFNSNYMLELEYEGETHTLGNLISSMGLEHEKIGESDFIGYRIVHPMLNKFILKLKINYDLDEARKKLDEASIRIKLRKQHIKVLYEIVNNIINYIEKKLISEWKSV